MLQGGNSSADGSGIMDENKEAYEMDFSFKKTVWNKAMVVKFKENEDIGKVEPITIKMQNMVLKGVDDNTLELVLTIIQYATLGVIAFMFVKKKPLVWNIIDTVTTMCFMIYLNFEIPFNVMKLFYFFNIKRFE